MAKPPLYRLKQGKQERYIEKEGELEETLLADKLERFEVFDRHNTPFRLTEARWKRYTRLLKQYEGWASALRAAVGHDLVGFLESSNLLDDQLDDVDALRRLLGANGDGNGRAFTLALAGGDAPGELNLRAVERKTGHARTYRIRPTLFEREEYRQLMRVHGELVSAAGMPPFRIVLGDQEAEALSFDQLRARVLDLAGKGVEVNRFKGLGEMDADQLRKTTMDPATRTLAQVTMEDAVEADRIFSMLMGDQVEPRREFIEANARSVMNLDV
jgi:DNA gyrase subunit B